MSHEFLVTPPRLNQALETTSSGGGSVSNDITRRTFLERTGGATVATLVAGLAVLVVALQLLACDRAKTRHKDDNTTPRSSLVSPEHSRRNESVEALATREPFGVSKKIKNDPEGALRFWIASRDNYRREEWDDMMGKYLILDDIPLALREQAYSLLSPSSRLECARDLFRHYLREKTVKECWAFYNSLPYDSISQRQVSALFWESVLRGCDLDATAKQLSVFEDEYGHGVDFLIKGNLPNIAGSSEVAAFLERLPPQYRTGEMIMKLSSSESVSISYADVWSLFQDSERNNFRDLTIKNLARKGAMTHKDLLDYMQTESSIGFDKLVF